MAARFDLSGNVDFRVALGPKEVVVALKDCRFAMERISRILTAS